MIYECIANTNDQKFITAKAKPAVWSGSELTPPFEIIYTQDLQTQTADYQVTLNYSFGDVVVNASEIDAGLVNNNG